ncbi:MAG: hypothetical protein Hals2KO_24020 [Halioglobus sp.]
MAVAVVPLKDLVQAKSRLAGLLSPAERRDLAQAMAEDVLATLAQHAGIAETVLVSDDPAAAMLASHYGARWQPERALGCRGLNAVLTRVCNNLQGQPKAAMASTTGVTAPSILQPGPDAAPDAVTEPGMSQTVLVLHADLPWLSTADLDAVLQPRAQHKLVIGTDRHGRGTNLLAFSQGHGPAFRFGPDSRRLHESDANAANRPVGVLKRPGIELDVDEPEDLARLLGQPERLRCGRTREVLFDNGLAARIELALASLEVSDACLPASVVDGETVKP